MNNEKMHNDKGGWIYRTFKTYLRFLHDKIFYKKVYLVNTEAIPPAGTPLLIVSNGREHYCCKIDYQQKRYFFYREIPDYLELGLEK